MSVFLLPSTLKDKLQKMMNSFIGVPTQILAKELVGYNGTNLL